MDVGDRAAWGPMEPEQLCDVLRMAAEVADADPGHDLLTALDVLNKDVLRPAERPRLYEAELRQVAAVLLAAIPELDRADSMGGEVASVNTWLAQHGRVHGRPASTGKVLAELFRRAAEQIEVRRSVEPTAKA